MSWFNSAYTITGNTKKAQIPHWVNGNRSRQINIRFRSGAEDRSRPSRLFSVSHANVRRHGHICPGCACSLRDLIPKVRHGEAALMHPECYIELFSLINGTPQDSWMVPFIYNIFTIDLFLDMARERVVYTVYIVMQPTTWYIILWPNYRCLKI